MPDSRSSSRRSCIRSGCGDSSTRCARTGASTTPTSLAPQRSWRGGASRGQRRCASSLASACPATCRRPASSRPCSAICAKWQVFRRGSVSGTRAATGGSAASMWPFPDTRSSLSSTAGAGTTRRLPSSTTAIGRTSSCALAGGSSASPGGRSTTSLNGSSPSSAPFCAALLPGGSAAHSGVRLAQIVSAPGAIGLRPPRLPSMLIGRKRMKACGLVKGLGRSISMALWCAGWVVPYA